MGLTTYESTDCRGQRTPLTKKFSPLNQRRSQEQFSSDLVSEFQRVQGSKLRYLDYYRATSQKVNKIAKIVDSLKSDPESLRNIPG